MKKIAFIIALLVTLSCSVPAFGEGSFQKAEFSTNKVTLSSGETNFSADITIANQGAFSSAEFGLRLEGNLKIKSIDYNNSITATKVNVLEKNGISYFGFFGADNDYSGTIKVCTVNFEYQGSSAAYITLAEANVTTVKDNGGAVKETLTPNDKITVGRSMSSSDGNGSGHTITVTTPAPPAVDGSKITVAPVIDHNVAQVDIGQNTMDQAFGQAQDDGQGIKTITIEAPKSSQTVNHYSVTMPSEFFTDSKGDRGIRINTPIATVQIRSGMIPRETVGSAPTVTVNVRQGSPEKLSEEAKQQVGNRPVVELYVSLNGRTIPWENSDSAVVVSVPYTPSAKELENPGNIVVWYIGEDGISIPVKNGVYYPQTGMVTFRVNHFGQYGIAYTARQFEDTGDCWAASEIEFLAVRGIINGSSESTYSPDESITRADFLKLLVGVLDREAGWGDGFDDVTERDYYYSAVMTAKALGLASGTGSGLFEPNAPIARQDMMVLIDRALVVSGKGLTDTADLSAFSDSGEIAGYANESVAKLVKSGIIQGDNGRLNPEDNLTRAEAARVLYMVFPILMDF